MGNWRTVDMRGHMDPAEAADMIEYLDYDSDWSKWEIDAACLLMSKSICGLNQWVDAAGNIDAVGNLAERDFDNDDIEKALNHLVERYPSMDLTLHSGSDWESLDCSATFRVKDGVVIRMEPQVATIREISSGSMQTRLMSILMNRQ